MVILPLRAIKNVVRKGFVYTISAYVYAFRFAFSCILYCILHHFTLHLAPKRTAFSTKMHSILHQNALYFAANSPKTGVSDDQFKYIFISPH